MAPQQVIDSSGADVLRLWVASSDYAEDVRLSPVILSQVSESYRKIRNTIRFCLANISDYIPPGPNPPKDRMRSLDRWILGELGSLVAQVTDAYDAYAFHRAVKGIHEFCTIRLSNFYLDVVKDILYTAHPDDAGRRSAQAALYWIARTLILLLSPILPVTAEEAWGSLPPGGGGEGQSVHLQLWPSSPMFDDNPAARGDWEKLLALRDEAMKALEKARASGLIGDALESELEIGARDEKLWSFLETRREDLAAACIVSGLKLVRTDGTEADPSFTVRKAPGAKCERCWMRLESVGRSLEHPGLCRRCVEVVHRLTRLR